MSRLTKQRIERALAKQERSVRVAFLKAIADKGSSLNLRALARAIERGDLNQALNIAGLTRVDMFPLDQSLIGSYVAGAATVAEAAPAFAASFGFDGRATRAEAFARDHVGGLVTRIVDDQRTMLQTVISERIGLGNDPGRIALDIAGRVNRATGVREGGFIGLDSNRARFLGNARDQLESLDAGYFTRKLRNKRFDGLVRRAIADGKPLSQVDINRITQAYANNLLLDRGKTIARTESITALRAGRHEGVIQAIEQGAIKEDSLERVWSTTGDSRVRDDHADVDGMRVKGKDTPFVLPDGSRLMFPGDSSLGAAASQTIQCRCFEEFSVDWLRG